MDRLQQRRFLGDMAALAERKVERALRNAGLWVDDTSGAPPEPQRGDALAVRTAPVDPTKP